MIAGILLAGGMARRMGGGDKILRLVSGRTMLDRVIERVRPQVGALAVSANGDPARFGAAGLPVLPDTVPGLPGPLAGILAGLDWAAALPGVTHLASFAGDTPFLPRDLVARLGAALPGGADAACAASAGRLHPVFGLWPLDGRAGLRAALVGEHLRKVEDWARRHRLTVVDFPAVPFDPFFNVNRSEDLAAADRIAVLDD